MIRAVNLPQRLANILAARGKTADFTRDVQCFDDGDGLPPRLAYWDAAKLGPEPTQAEVDAASDGPTDEQSNKPILRELEENDRKIVRALVDGDTKRIEEHKARQAALRARLK